MMLKGRKISAGRVITSYSIHYTKLYDVARPREAAIGVVLILSGIPVYYYLKFKNAKDPGNKTEH